jgi:hypothetical protein
MPSSHILAAVVLIALSAPAAARTETKAEPPSDTQRRVVETGKTAGRIVTQPVQDVGVKKIVVPPAVEKAAAAPYSSKGLHTCARIRSELDELNDVLGPDFDGTQARKEDRAGKIAEAGGKTVVNAFIPFRGLVRELTGAAPAQRRLNAALDAAYARRGYLRGIAQMRKCHIR